MNSKHYLISQINSSGNETGKVKLISGTDDAAKYLSRDESSETRKDAIFETLNSMECGSFDVVYSGDFIYEVDCINDEDAGKIELENDDIVEKKIAVFELFDGSKIFHAFGENDLREKLGGMTFSADSINSAIEILKNEDFADVSSSDPKLFTITVEKLSDHGVTKLEKIDQKFALELATAKKNSINESAKLESSSGDYCGFKLQCGSSEKEGHYCKIFKGDDLINSVYGFDNQEDAMASARNRIDFGKLNESGEGSSGVCSIKFAPAIAAEAKKALNDDEFIRHNIEWISDSVIEFPIDGEDDELLSDISDTLSEAGISNKDFEISK